jgi:hypothetical protein
MRWNEFSGWTSHLKVAHDFTTHQRTLDQCTNYIDAYSGTNIKGSNVQIADTSTHDKGTNVQIPNPSTHVKVTNHWATHTCTNNQATNVISNPPSPKEATRVKLL